MKILTPRNILLLNCLMVAGLLTPPVLRAAEKDEAKNDGSVPKAKQSEPTQTKKKKPKKKAGKRKKETDESNQKPSEQTKKEQKKDGPTGK